MANLCNTTDSSISRAAWNVVLSSALLGVTQLDTYKHIQQTTTANLPHCFRFSFHSVVNGQYQKSSMQYKQILQLFQRKFNEMLSQINKIMMRRQNCHLYAAERTDLMNFGCRRSQDTRLWSISSTNDFRANANNSPDLYHITRQNVRHLPKSANKLKQWFNPYNTHTHWIVGVMPLSSTTFSRKEFCFKPCSLNTSFLVTKCFQECCRPMQ